MAEDRNTSLDRGNAARLNDAEKLLKSLTKHHLEVTAMMRLSVQDGLSAMQYGQHGGSTPDPTGATAIVRGRVAEGDLASYNGAVADLFAAANLLDTIRRRHMSANMDIRNRLDPTDWCRIHFALHLYEGHRRHKGDLCKTCADFQYGNPKTGQPAVGREPTPTECDYWFRHGAWPQIPIDPKARRVG